MSQVCSGTTQQAKCLTFGQGLQAARTVGCSTIMGETAGQHRFELNPTLITFSGINIIMSVYLMVK